MDADEAAHAAGAAESRLHFFQHDIPAGLAVPFPGTGCTGQCGAVPYLLASVLALTVMGSFWGLSVQLVTFREQGILRRFRLAPVSAGAMLASSILSNYLMTLPTVLLEFWIARGIFDLRSWGNISGIILLVTLGIVTFAALGLIVASVTNTMQETQIINQILWWGFMVLSGATLPLPMLPGWLQNLAAFQPATYLVAGLERVMVGQVGVLRIAPELLSLALSARHRVCREPAAISLGAGGQSAAAGETLGRIGGDSFSAAWASGKARTAGCARTHAWITSRWNRLRKRTPRAEPRRAAAVCGHRPCGTASETGGSGRYVIICPRRTPMSLKKTEQIWHNGKLIRWDDAHIHVLSHVVSYGSSVFEGIRCYETPQGPATFRVRDHMQRLIRSGHIYRMENPYSADQLSSASHELVRANRLSSCYIRPLVLRGYGDVGVSPLNCPLEVYIAAWEWGAYLGQEALEEGVDVCVSSWTRMAPNTLPAMAKAGANYMNSQLIRMEAAANGYAEGIALDVQRQCQRRLGREHLPGAGRRRFHASAGVERSAGHHAKFDHGAVRGPAHPGARADDSPRDAVHRRRGFLHRHGRRSDAAALESTASRSARASAARSPSGCKKSSSPSSAAANQTVTTGSPRSASPVGASVA